MAEITAQIDDGGIIETIVWKDGEIVSDNFVSDKLETRARALSGTPVTYLPNPVIATTFNHIESPYSAVMIMLMLWDIDDITWLFVGDVPAPPQGDHIEMTAQEIEDYYADERRDG